MDPAGEARYIQLQVSLACTAAALLSVGVAGLLPRPGPVGAISLALRSKLRTPVGPPSDRVKDIAGLSRLLNAIGRGERAYIVVTGQKGVGKTCLIETVTAHKCGVLRVKAGPSESHIHIIRSALEEVAGSFSVTEHRAKRVISWYNLFAKNPPLVVINATERGPYQGYAGISEAARTLNDEFGLRVLVESSPSAMPLSEGPTSHEMIVNIEPMPRALLRKLPELQPLFEVTKTCGLDDALYGVLGGVPSRYQTLRILLSGYLTMEDKCKCVSDFLVAEVSAAIIQLRSEKITYPRLIPILKLADDKGEISLDSIPLDMPSPLSDKVLCLVYKGGRVVYRPATPALGLVISEKLVITPSIHELKFICAVKEEQKYSRGS